MTLPEFLDRFDGVRLSGAGQWMARCPAHEDRTPSLSIGIGNEGRRLLHCLAGCSLEAILDAARLTLGDLFEGTPERPRIAPGPPTYAQALYEALFHLRRRRERLYAPYRDHWQDSLLINAERRCAEEARQAADALPDPDSPTAWGLRELAAELDLSANYAEATQDRALREMRRHGKEDR
jgi:hypothetical protein